MMLDTLFQWDIKYIILASKLSIHPMAISETEFPREQLLVCLREANPDYEYYLSPVRKMNIEWTYELIKHCYNVLFQIKEAPKTKVQALHMFARLLETCTIPSINLIEVYLIPAIYEFASFKSPETGYRRGSSFFQLNGYSARLSGIEEDGMKFIKLCVEILFVGSKIKKWRCCCGEDLTQESDFVAYYNKIHEKCGDSIPVSPLEIEHFDPKFLKRAADQYAENLRKFSSHSSSASYGEFFVGLTLDSLQTENNPLFSNAGKTVSTLSTDLDLRQLFRFGDDFITTLLLQELVEGIKAAENFMIKRNFLSLLSDFVKWADMEAFAHVLYSDVLDDIVPRLAEVEGRRGLGQGDNIYPEIKGQREAKKKFYVEFLKSIEMWAWCIEKDLEDPEESSRANQYYQFLKVERQFIFPENIMAKKILEQFHKSLLHNSQRNLRLLARLKADKTSLLNNKKSSHHFSSANLKNSSRPQINFTDLNMKFDRATQLFFSLCEEESTLPKKMRELVRFRNGFQDDLQNLDEDRPGDEFEELLENGDFLNDKVRQVEKAYIQYRAKKITFESFRKQYIAVADSQQEPRQYLGKTSQEDISLSNSNSKHSIKRVMVDSQERVLSSFNPVEKDTSFQPENNLFSKISEEQAEKVSSRHSKSKADDSSNVLKKSYEDQKLAKGMKSFSHSEKQSSVHSSRDKIHKNSKDMMGSPTFNKHQLIYDQPENQEQIHPYYGASELSKKNQYQKFQKQPSEQSSRFRRKAYHSRNSNHASNSKNSLKERIEVHRENRRSSINSNSSKASYRRRKSSHKSELERIPVQNINIQSQSYNAVPATHTHADSTRRQEGRKRDSIREKSETFHNQINMQSMRSGDPSQYESQKHSGSSFHPLQENYDYYDGDLGQYGKKSLKKWEFKARHSRASQIPLEDSNARSRSSKRSQGMEIYEQRAQDYGHPLQPDMLSSLHQRSSKVVGESKNKMGYSGNYDGLQTSLFDQDCIREPDATPAENSYYAYNEIERKVKKSRKVPDFKQCLQLDKEVIPLYGRTEEVVRKVSVEKGRLFRKDNSADGRQQLSHSRNKQEEYLMKKLRREYKREQDEELRKTNSRIKKLRSQNSGSPAQRSERSDKSKEHSISKPSFYNHTSKGIISFTASKNNSGSSSSRGRQSGMRRIDSQVLQGQILNDLPYLRYFGHIQDDKTKRTFLKQKTLLLKNEYLEVGSLFSRDASDLKITLYITPEIPLSSLTLNTSKESHVSVKLYPQSFHHLEQTKQVKSTVAVTLEEELFCPPTVTFNVRIRSETKQYAVYLPCPITRFLDFKPVQNMQSFFMAFEGQEQGVIKTPWLRMHKKIGKIDHMMEYFPKFTRLGQEGEYTKFGAYCAWGANQFALALTTCSPNKVAIQGAVQRGLGSQAMRLMEFVMSSLQHLFTLGD